MSALGEEGSTVAVSLEEADFSFPLRPLRSLLVQREPYAVAALPLATGTLRVAVSSPAPEAAARFLAEATFGAAVTPVPDARLSAVGGPAIAAALRATAARLVEERGANYEALRDAAPYPSAAGLVSRVGGSVERLIAETAVPLLADAEKERASLPEGERWIGPPSLIDAVRELAFVRGAPIITEQPWPPRSPVSRDPDLAVSVGLSYEPAEPSEQVEEIRFRLDPSIDYASEITYWCNGSLDVAFRALRGSGLVVYDAYNLGGRTGGIGNLVYVSWSSWTTLTSTGYTDYETFGTLQYSRRQARWIGG